MNTATEEDFRECINALDEVLASFEKARSTIVVSRPPQADLTAYLLLEAVYRNVNAVSAIALIPYAGSHLISATLLLRAAFEATITASWLIAPENMVEREGRWIGWIDKQIDEEETLSRTFRRFNSSEADARDKRISDLKSERESLMNSLAGVQPIPLLDLRERLRRCGIDDRYYVFYKISSQVSHGGDVIRRHLWTGDRHQIYPRDVEYREWAEWLCMGSWCLALSAPIVFARFGVSRELAIKIDNAHKRLASKVSVLDGRDRKTPTSHFDDLRPATDGPTADVTV